MVAVAVQLRTNWGWLKGLDVAMCIEGLVTLPAVTFVIAYF
jgi:hypothetical protein